MSLEGKVAFVSGATRGIGLAIARKLAKSGARLTIIGKTVERDPRLPGTLSSAEAELNELGAEVLALRCDIRHEEEVSRCVRATVERFGGIDILINNASAIDLSSTLKVEMKRYDLMQQVNGRGSFLVGKYCLPHLLKTQGRIITLSPPLSMKPEYFGPHLAYSIAKFSMSLCTLGWAHEFANKVAANSLWPQTAIDTAAVRNLLGGEASARRCRTPEIVADAAKVILEMPLKISGNFFMDEEVLRKSGVQDFEKYRAHPGEESLLPDFFLP